MPILFYDFQKQTDIAFTMVVDVKGLRVDQVHKGGKVVKDLWCDLGISKFSELKGDIKRSGLTFERK